jgi:hypothetical protein
MAIWQQSATIALTTIRYLWLRCEFTWKQCSALGAIAQGYAKLNIDQAIQYTNDDAATIAILCQATGDAYTITGRESTFLGHR